MRDRVYIYRQLFYIFKAHRKREEMFNEMKFHEVCKEMRSIVTLEEVNEFVDLARAQEHNHHDKAFDLENALKSEYLSPATRDKMKKAIENHKLMERKWNALWAVFDHAEFHSVKN